MPYSASILGEATIRPAVPDDAAALAEFAERSFCDTFARDNRPEDMARHVATAFGIETQRAEISDPRGIVLLMESGGHIVGYAQLLRRSAPLDVVATSTMELQRFYIAHVWHGLGLAQRLMHRALAASLERDAATVWLGVWERNARAIAFYRKVGFVDVGSQGFVLGNDQQTDRIMCRATHD